MESVFTLPYPEFESAHILRSYFKKKDGFSVLFPSSRQQKGFDLVLFNQNTGKVATIQIKSSRSWRGNKFSKFPNWLWFNNFNLADRHADFYLLFGVFPKNLSNLKFNKSRKPNSW